jgi:hypothetical protein
MVMPKSGQVAIVSDHFQAHCGSIKFGVVPPRQMRCDIHTLVIDEVLMSGNHHTGHGGFVPHPRPEKAG